MTARPSPAKRAPHLSIAELGACAVVFLSAFEPNLALRYGPFIAFGVFLFSNPMRFRIGLTEVLLFGFLGWALVAQLWTANTEAYELHMLSLLAASTLFIGLRQAFSEGARIGVVALGFVAGCIVGLVRTSPNFATPEAIRDVSGRVAQVNDLNVNYVAYVSVVCVVVLTLLLRSPSLRTQSRRAPNGRGWLVVAGTLVLMGGAFATQTRGAQLAIGLVALWYVVALFARPLKALVTVTAIIAVSVSMGWADTALKVFDYGNRSLSGLSGRFDLWEVARALWEEQPLTGAGFGAVRALTLYGLPAHNTILEIGSSLGIVGVLLFGAFVISALTDRTKQMSVASRRVQLGAVTLALAPIALSSTWEFSAAAWVTLALLAQPLGASVTANPTETTAIKAVRVGSPRN